MYGGDLLLSLNASFRPLTTLLRELSEATTNDDRAFGTQPSLPGIRIHAFCSRAPLSRVLNGLAALLNYAWLNSAAVPITSFISPNDRSSLARSSQVRRYEDRMLRDYLRDGAGPLFRLAAW